jgi:murein DD-endopeptidase MepM/ murein hydrolase activator NlpD
VDSIYKRLDTLQVIINSDSKDYPSLDFEQQLKPNYTFDPALKNRMEELETKLATILVVISDPVTSNYNSTLEASESDFIPSIYPTFGRISDGWGLRVHPISNEIEFHYGIDIANQPGTPIYATAAGTVVTTDYDTSYGKRIIIDHGSGYQTLYGHLYSYMVHSGDNVIKGQIIGLMGSSGVSTGPHMHYEVRDNQAKINPTAYQNRIDEPRYAMR